jgi:hypothetical protein
VDVNGSSEWRRSQSGGYRVAVTGHPIQARLQLTLLAISDFGKVKSNVRSLLSLLSCVCLSIALGASFALQCSPVCAATFNIANGNVAGLITALTIANGNDEDDTINLAAHGSYILTNAQNLVDGPTGLPVIQADGGHTLFLNGNDALIQRSTAGSTPSFRILNIASGKVTIVHLTISNGRAFGTNFAGDNSGGGIFNRGTLTLRNCVITGNAAVAGVGSNSAGGGIFNYAGTLSLTENAIVVNSASGTTDFVGGDGGGLYNFGGVATLIDTTIDSNVAIRNNPSGGGTGGDGGGIVNSNGVMTIRNSTIVSNSCTLVGGGIVNLASSPNNSLTLVNSTLSNNATSASGGSAGIFNQSAALNLTNTTISSNVAPFVGGINTFGGSTVRALNTIVAGNSANTSSSADINASDTITSLGHNLIGIADSSSGWVSSDLTGTSASPLDPMLLPLAANGGPTQTRALQSSSPAINAGDNALLNAPFNVNSDQRLFARKAGAAVDIGAFELNASPVARADLNGDSFIDYLLFNASSRRTALWYLRTNTLLAGVFGPTLPVGWNVASVADLNVDGGRDLVLLNSSTRQTAIWFLRNATFVGGTLGPTLPAGWTLIAAENVIGDDQPDYVLFNPTTRQSAFWFARQTTFSGGVFGPTLPAGWTLIDVLDFNADGKPDYLLFNPGTRRTAIWRLNGAAFLQGDFGPTLPVGWLLQGASDFNGDGKPDYLLFQPSTRRSAIWYLNGSTFTAGVFGPTLPAGYNLVSP